MTVVIEDASESRSTLLFRFLPFFTVVRPRFQGQDSGPRAEYMLAEHMHADLARSAVKSGALRKVELTEAIHGLSLGPAGQFIEIGRQLRWSPRRE